MKKYLAIVLIVCMAFLCVGCDGNVFEFSGFYAGNKYDKYGDIANDYADDYTSGFVDYTSDYLDYASDYVDDYVDMPPYTPSGSDHTHYYVSSVTRDATCGATGVMTYTCSCGDTYTEIIPKTSYHDWDYATCTAPQTCKDCGTTQGSANGHSYYSDGKCGRCGQPNPTISQTLAQCSLSLPSLPKTVSELDYDGDIEVSVQVTAITYKFDCDNEGNIELEVYFSGTKTYDYRGSGQSAACKIGWKLFAPDGSVIDSDTFYSPSVAIGESFSNKSEQVLYSWDNGQPGNYRLEIINVN